MPCYSPLKGYKARANGGLTFRKEESAGEKMEVACGQCIGCRLDRSRMWAIRISHERSMHDDKGGNCFVTLTYDDEHLPAYGSLVKDDFQNFMKKVRVDLVPKVPFWLDSVEREQFMHEYGIRYFMCGEYGEADDGLLGRPHYHACIFNCDFGEWRLWSVSDCGEPIYTSAMLSRYWDKGFAVLSNLTYESAGYVARYCLKKVTGMKADDHYSRCDAYTGEWNPVEHEYNDMSRRPGIGATWFKKFHGDVFPRDEVPVVGAGVFKGAPRYYDELLRRMDDETLEHVKEVRQEFRRAFADEYTPERLMAKYNVKKAQLEFLKRSL